MSPEENERRRLKNMTPEVWRQDSGRWACSRVEVVGCTTGYGDTRDEAILAWVEAVEKRRTMGRPQNEVAPIVLPKNDWPDA